MTLGFKLFVRYVVEVLIRCLLNILVYYGNYEVDNIYNINDFMQNEDIPVKDAFHWIYST